MQFDKVHRRLPGVVRVPIRFRPGGSGKILHDPVHGDDVRPFGNEWTVGFEFGQYMIAGVTAIQKHHDPFPGMDELSDLPDDATRNRVSLNHRDQIGEFVRFDGLTIVRPDLDVNPDDPPAPDEATQSRAEDQ